MTPEVKNQKAEFWNQVGELFMKRIAPYELQEPKRVFVRLMDLADFANPRIPADVGAWCEAIYSQLKRHIHDKPPMFSWVPGKVPPLVSGHQAQLVAQNKHTSGSAADQAEFDTIGRENAEQQARERERERLKGVCEYTIANFYPVKFNRLSYSVRQSVQAILTKYLEEQYALVTDMNAVAARIGQYIDNEYKKLAPSEKLGPTTTHMPGERL